MPRHTTDLIPVLGLLGLLSLDIAHTPAHAEDVITSPGQQEVFLSLTNKSTRLDGGATVFPPAVIAKGKKGHVLTVAATGFAFSFDSKELSMLPVVNNRYLQPPFSQSFPACPIAAGST